MKYKKEVEAKLAEDFCGFLPGNLVYLRTLKGWTLRQVEKKIGKSAAMICQIENAKILRPHMTTLKLLADVYGVSVNDLLTKKMPAPYGRPIPIKKRMWEPIDVRMGYIYAPTEDALAFGMLIEKKREGTNLAYAVIEPSREKTESCFVATERDGRLFIERPSEINRDGLRVGAIIERYF